MLTISATVGAVDANSFVTEADAIAYAATRLNLVGWSTVAGTVCTEREMMALVEATRELDLLRYKGIRATSTQALSWPRAYAIIEEDIPLDTILATENVYLPNYYVGVPQRLRNATIELAFEFLRAGATDISRLDPSAGIVRKKVDVLETEWEPGARRTTGLARFPRVVAMLMPLLAVSGNEVIRS